MVEGPVSLVWVSCDTSGRIDDLIDISIHFFAAENSAGKDRFKEISDEGLVDANRKPAWIAWEWAGIIRRELASGLDFPLKTEFFGGGPRRAVRRGDTESF